MALAAGRRCSSGLWCARSRLHGWRGFAGRVVIAGGDGAEGPLGERRPLSPLDVRAAGAGSPSSSSSSSTKSSSSSSSAGRRAQYAIPNSYLQLLSQDLLRHGGGEKGSSEDSAEADAGAALEDGADAAPSREENPEDRRRAFWREARILAKERLGSLLGPDPPEWERRAARLHEGLWVEELGVLLELEKWRLTAESIPRESDGLFSLDVSNFSDEMATPLEDGAFLRGLRLLIRCSRGKRFTASPQPGSGSGRLLLSAPDHLEGAQGPFSVKFRPNRFQQVAMHSALDAAAAESALRAVAVGTGGGLGAEARSVEEADAAAAALPSSLNDCQRRAILACLEVGARHPLAIWGPPGTGKSTVAAFIIWHLLQQRPGGLRILVAAPSNTGADVLCAKLVKLGLDKRQMLRLNALSRSMSTVPAIISDFCYQVKKDDGKIGFGVPPLPQLRDFHVIVTTCIASAHIANALKASGSQGGWFSHVVIDEAGEATEPETMVPLSLQRPVAARAILLGDHFQLGPLVLTPLACELSRLQSSMIERLANERFREARAAQDDKKNGNLSGHIMVECEDRGLYFLTDSYRSHPDIMSLYSRMFYSDQLDHRPRREQLELLPFFQSKGLPGPVLMHHVVGKERRDPGTPSVYNNEEVRLVASYVADLLENKVLQNAPHEIGVITPYARQVRAIESHLRSLGPKFQGVQVGTVEHFQGQERRAIVMSTVRSANMGVASTAASSRRPIGFLSDKRRLNVAISRAVAGFIVIGDLATLSRHCHHWRALVAFGKEAGSLVGEPLDVPRVHKATEAQLEAASKPSQAVRSEEAAAAWNALTGGP